MGPTRVLIVEDSTHDRELVRRWISKSYPDAVIETAATMAAARERLSFGPVDVIVLDLSLPDSDREKTLKEIPAMATSAAVLVLSGGLSDGDAATAKGSGAACAMDKDELLRRAVSHDPSLIEELRHKLHSIVRRRRGG